MYKIGIIGNGWRAKTYLTIINQLPNLFKLEGIYIRDKVKADEFSKNHSNNVFTDINDFYKREYDFIIIAIPRKSVLQQLEQAFINKVPVLCETPPCDGLDQLEKLWLLKQKYNAKIQVAEQYFCQPYNRALLKLVNSGKLSEISNVSLSMAHDYHSISLMRKFLNIKMENCKIKAMEYDFPVIRTCDRQGVRFDGEISNTKTILASFNFENKKTGFHRFHSEQYFNYLRSRHINIQGLKGEINDFNVSYLNDKNIAVEGKIVRKNLGEYSNLEGYSLHSIQLNGEVLVENPFINARLSDEEIAMAILMKGMGEYVHGGKEIYPLEDALQDTYLYLLMHQAVTDGEIETSKQIWQH